MGFGAFVSWAKAQSGDIEAVVANAAGTARYEDPVTADRFRDDLGNAWNSAGGASLAPDAFPGMLNRVCAKYQLSGEPIPLARVPERVCRLARWPSLRNQIGEALGMDSATARARVQLSGLKNSWQAGDKAISVSGRTPSALKVRMAGRGPGSDRRAVFAAFEIESAADPRAVTGAHNPFWGRLVSEGSAGDLAGYAVEVLGLTPEPVPLKPPPPPEARVLAEYPSERFNEWRLPVPPDARDNGLFRPVKPGMSLEYGRTFPRGAKLAEWQKGGVGTNEAVHSNDELSLSDTEMTYLGET